MKQTFANSQIDAIVKDFWLELNFTLFVEPKELD